MKTILSLFFILQGFIVYGQPREDRLDSLVNQNAPNFIAETLGGEIFDLSEHKGKIVMVNFWSLSCAACFKEIVDFNIIVEERSEDNFLLISLMDNSKEELNNKIIKNGKFYKLKKPVFKNDLIEFEIIPSADKIMKEYKFGRGFPLTFFIDKNGIIRDYVHGYLVSYEGVPGMLTNYDAHNNKINKLMKF
ncbi:MAG: TlpA family protein disulfide reductase [Bacteroidetes bacterium]|nr:TlpA family protein disulfide reductase [Bacteroidota bacterium]